MMRKLVFCLILVFSCSVCFGAVDFNGDADYLACDEEYIANLSSATVCAWILPDVQQRGDIYSEGNSVAAENADLVRLSINEPDGNNDNVQFQVRQDLYPDANSIGLSANSGDVNIHDGNAHSVCGRINSKSSIEVFFDGTSKAEDTSVTLETITPNKQTIGCLIRDSVAIHFSGTIFEVITWNTALTDAQILQYHTAKLKMMPVQILPANVLNYWILNDKENANNINNDVFYDFFDKTETCTGVDADGDSYSVAETVLSYP